MSLNDVLRRFGLNDSEQAVLISLLRDGSAAPSQLAKRAEIKRPTAYAALETLERQGLVTREKSAKGARFRAVPKASIPEIFKRRAEIELARARDLGEVLEAELQSIVQREQIELAGFELSTIEYGEAVYAHLERTLHRGDFASIFNPQDIPDDQLHGVVSRFLESTAKSKPRIREIAVSGVKTRWYKRKIRNPNHTVKELPAGTEIRSDLILVGGDIVVSSYQPENERALRIREPHIYRTLMTVFENLWETLP